MDIKLKKNGLRKRRQVQTCLACNTEMVFIKDQIEEFMEKYNSMESTLYQCPQCKRYFIEYEKNDYDYYVLVEVEVL